MRLYALGGGFRNKNPASSVPVTIGPSRRGWRRLPRERMLSWPGSRAREKGGAVSLGAGGGGLARSPVAFLYRWSF